MFLATFIFLPTNTLIVQNQNKFQNGEDNLLVSMVGDKLRICNWDQIGNMFPLKKIKTRDYVIYGTFRYSFFSINLIL